MPYIHVSLSSQLSEAQKSELKEMLGRTIEVLPGKSENVLMLRIDDGCRMYFSGTSDDCAFLAVHLFRASPEDNKKIFAREVVEKLCQIVGLDEDRIFMNLQEHDSWVAGGNML